MQTMEAVETVPRKKQFANKLWISNGAPILLDLLGGSPPQPHDPTSGNCIPRQGWLASNEVPPEERRVVCDLGILRAVLDRKLSWIAQVLMPNDFC